MSTALTTPPPRQPMGKGVSGDAWFAQQKNNDAIGNLNNAVGALQSLIGTTEGSLSFGNIAAGQPQGNLKTELLQGGSPATANTPFTLNHTLGKIPNGAILVQSNTAAILSGSALANGWTKTTITLLINQPSVAYTILVL